MDNREFNITARRLEKAFGEYVLPRPSPEFIEEQERRESLASASVLLQAAHGIGMIVTYFLFFFISIYAYATLDPEAIATSSLSFGCICLFWAYLLSPLNQSDLKASEIPMDSYVFRSILGRPTK